MLLRTKTKRSSLVRSVAWPVHTIFGSRLWWVGLSAALAFAPHHYWFLAVFSLIILMVVGWACPSWKHAWHCGWWWGLGFYMGTLYWIGHALWIEADRFAWLWPGVVLGGPAVLALYPAVMMGCIVWLRCRYQWIVSEYCLAFALIWSATEWIQGHAWTGFPWNLMAYIWGDLLPIAQMAAFLGSYGLSLATILWISIMGGILLHHGTGRKNILPKWMTECRLRSVQGVGFLKAGLFGGISFAMIFFLGSWRLFNHPTQFHEKILLRCVQPVIDQKEKMNPAYHHQHWQRLLRLSCRTHNQDKIWVANGLDQDFFQQSSLEEGFLEWGSLDQGESEEIALKSFDPHRTKKNSVLSSFLDSRSLKQHQAEDKSYQCVAQYPADEEVKDGSGLNFESVIGNAKNSLCIQADTVKIQPDKVPVQPHDFFLHNSNKKNLRLLARPTHIIWPEGAFPWCLTPETMDQFPDLTSFSDLNDTVILFGGDYWAKETSLFNSLFVHTPKKSAYKLYAKMHLVPGGEYFPLRRVFSAIFPVSWLRKMTPGSLDFEEGPPLYVVECSGLPPFRALICYESIFPGTIRQRTKQLVHCPSIHPSNAQKNEATNHWAHVEDWGHMEKIKTKQNLQQTHGYFLHDPLSNTLSKSQQICKEPTSDQSPQCNLTMKAYAQKITPEPEWILNITNDGWFGESSGPHQHFLSARFRAIEEGLPLVRVANTGISAIVDPLGRIVQSLPLLEEGVIDGLLPKAIPRTVYGRWGNCLWASMMGVGTMILFIIRMMPFICSCYRRYFRTK